MKLQVNAKGSWKDVIGFEPEHEKSVREAAAVLAACAGKKFRITNETGDVVAWCRSPDFIWSEN